MPIYDAIFQRNQRDIFRLQKHIDSLALLRPTDQTKHLMASFKNRIAEIHRCNAIIQREIGLR